MGSRRVPLPLGIGFLARLQVPMSVDIGYFSLREKKMSEKADEDQQSSEEKSENETKKMPVFNNQEKLTLTEKLFSTYWGLATVFGVVSMLTVLFIAADECKQCFNKLENLEQLPEPLTKTFWTYGKRVTEGGHLKEVVTVLDRIGYRNNQSPGDDWDLLWAHDYPFNALQAELKHLRAHQKINHFPGIGYITNKVTLATSKLPYIPPAFQLPEDKEQLLEYSKSHPNRTFIQKSNRHREVKIERLANIDLDKAGTFVQEFMDKPLLVNGHMFDIGIYTIVTSIDPLRVYMYNGEALLRFCPKKYYPFDPTNLDKYVVGDDYMPIWEVPALDYFYNQLGFGMKESLNAHLRALGKDPANIWTQIEESLRAVLLAKEPLIADVLRKFRYKSNFFEMMRFDFIIDEDLKIYLLEANMSPNLSSEHFPPNRLLYQQVLYNVLGLVGVGERLHKNTLEVRSKEEREMMVSDKHLATYPEKCSSQLCKSSCASSECQLCKPCLSAETRRYLEEAFKEHLNRGDCKRIFPPVESKAEASKPVSDDYSSENQLHYKWFKGKCLLDSSWCNA